ncbi:hypothetical protein ABW20_dc0106125 [Dactylellina cionopaga]|nr:hypothetical protein ABW20_dc0106125 [Dactylellina cionopaga]
MPVFSTPDGAQTIEKLPDYLGLRGCAQLCFWQPYPGGFRTDAVASFLSCSQAYIYSGALESCWCRTDYQSDVISYISSCVSERCEPQPGDFTQDVVRATSIYAGYCMSVVRKENSNARDITSTGNTAVAGETGGLNVPGRTVTATVTATETVFRSAVGRVVVTKLNFVMLVLFIVVLTTLLVLGL